MKRIIFLLLSISINFSLIAQDKIDPDSYLDYLAAPDSIFNFNPNKFIKGWNWGSESRKLDSAMFMNCTHNQYKPTYGRRLNYKFTKNQNMILSNKTVGACDCSYALTQAQGIQYEPYIEVDTTDGFVPLENDNTGAVFGFKYRNPAFVANQDTYHQFVLRKSVLQNLGQDTATVLANPYPDDELKDLISTFRANKFCFKAGN